MPYASAFKEGFGLEVGTEIEDNYSGQKWRIDSVKIGHQVLVRYQSYGFPITLVLSSVRKDKVPKMQLHGLARNAISQFTKTPRIVYSQYGNPYLCEIPKWTVESSIERIDGKGISITLKAEGVGIRQRD